MWSVEVGIQRKTEGQKRREVVVEAETAAAAEDSRLLFPRSSAILINQRERIAFIQ